MLTVTYAHRLVLRTRPHEDAVGFALASAFPNDGGQNLRTRGLF